MEKINFKYGKNNYVMTTTYPNDHIFNNVKRRGTFYEINLLEKIKTLNLGGTYIDVGANVGNHTLFFAKECKASLVVGYETYIWKNTIY